MPTSVASYGCEFRKLVQNIIVVANQKPSDSIANIAKFDDAVADVPCENILGLVIYDLPGRDCAAKASNGEFSIANNGAANYENYIDQIVAQIKSTSYFFHSATFMCEREGWKVD